MAVNSQLRLTLQNQIDGEKLLLFVGLALSTLALALSICLANKKTHILLEFCLWLNSQVAGSKEVDYGCSQVDGNWGCTGAQIFAPACKLIYVRRIFRVKFNLGAFPSRTHCYAG